MNNTYDVIVLGGGPAGLAAAIEAKRAGANVLLLERESRLGGILKQCVHEGFGLLEFGERLTGPEYAQRFIDEFLALDIEYRLNAFALALEKGANFAVSVQCTDGILTYRAAALVLACGCRERTARQVFIHGTRPAGIFTAGTAQHFVNLLGKMPTRRCVILGSGDIGLIMARRLTLEGAQVEGVYEIKDAPAGLARNISQCLDDFHIPLHLSHTVTQVFGEGRVTAVEVAQVDEKLQPIPGTQRRVDCDALILSVGLLPENEIAQALEIPLDAATRGPLVNQSMMTAVDGIFSCGNALHVNDLADWVTKSARVAGKNAAAFAQCTTQDAPSRSIKIEYDPKEFLYVVPQSYDPASAEPLLLYFRSRNDVSEKQLQILADGKEILQTKYRRLLPSEMEVVAMEKYSEQLAAAGKLALVLS